MFSVLYAREPSNYGWDWFVVNPNSIVVCKCDTEQKANDVASSLNLAYKVENE